LTLPGLGVIRPQPKECPARRPREEEPCLARRQMVHSGIHPAQTERRIEALHLHTPSPVNHERRATVVVVTVRWPHRLGLTSQNPSIQYLRMPTFLTPRIHQRARTGEERSSCALDQGSAIPAGFRLPSAIRINSAEQLESRPRSSVLQLLQGRQRRNTSDSQQPTRSNAR
jgi:hypothetical protein